MNLRIQALAMELARHAGSYMELGAAAAAEYRSAWVRRSVMLLVAATTGVAGIAALWTAGLVALWDTPWRLTYVVASAAVLLATATISLYSALARRSSGPSAGLLQSELRKDMELFRQWKITL